MDTSRRSGGQSYQGTSETSSLKHVFTFFTLIIVFSPALAFLLYHPLPTSSSFETGALICEASGVIVRVIDGDTVDVKVDSACAEKHKSYVGSVIRVRFADIDAPELSTREGVNAKNFLIDTVSRYGDRVCLDIDDRRIVDPYNRVIAVVYVKFNETHWLNLNLYIVENGHARIVDFKDNEFNPYTWKLYVVLVDCGNYTTSATHDLTGPILELLKHWIPIVALLVAVLLVLLAASNRITTPR